jgi:hypothetical protein
MAVTLCVGMPPVTLCVTHRWSDMGCIPTQSVATIPSLFSKKGRVSWLLIAYVNNSVIS